MNIPLAILLTAALSISAGQAAAHIPHHCDNTELRAALAEKTEMREMAASAANMAASAANNENLILFIKLSGKYVTADQKFMLVLTRWLECIDGE